MENEDLSYRLSFISESGLCLAVTEYIEDKAAAIYVYDTIRENCRGKLRCLIETRSNGFVDMGGKK